MTKDSPKADWITLGSWAITPRLLKTEILIGVLGVLRAGPTRRMAVDSGMLMFATRFHVGETETRY
ncbi:hypothetical protein [Dactylosporangium sp. CA-233914]|uniref:hypothetical protein n=1 Tax=Dactylosporangium sp. CA-233914 TaxID=3239934 RepID=UPI003D8A2621